MGRLETRIQEIRCAIECYARAYGRLDFLQNREQNAHEPCRILPVGDQKTGVIGEFYALLYAQQSYSEATLAENNQPWWDIEAIGSSGETIKIQVKAVSAFSGYRRMTPIYPGIDELWAIYLDKRFRPTGFWMIDGTCLPFNDDEQPLKGRTCPDPGKEASQGLFATAPNRVKELPLR